MTKSKGFRGNSQRHGLNRMGISNQKCFGMPSLERHNKVFEIIHEPYQNSVVLRKSPRGYDVKEVKLYTPKFMDIKNIKDVRIGYFGDLTSSANCQITTDEDLSCIVNKDTNEVVCAIKPEDYAPVGWTRQMEVI